MAVNALGQQSAVVGRPPVPLDREDASAPGFSRSDWCRAILADTVVIPEADSVNAIGMRM